MKTLIRAGVMALALLAGGNSLAAGFAGTVLDEAGEPIVGAMVTARFNLPFQERTVFTDDAGRYRLEGLPPQTEYLFRVRRIGWRDVRSAGHELGGDGTAVLDFTMVRHTDPADVAAQLPANHWW